TKNEIIPIPKLPTIAKVDDDEELEAVGEVMSIVGTVVIVKAYQDGSNRVLDTDSMLVFEDRKVLGLIYETFGPVLHPMYTVRFPTVADMDPNVVQTSRKVFHVAKRSSFLFTSALRTIKGSDASNLHDEEIGEDEMEFSDDEQEVQFRARLSAR
ncbi:hypothetical protein BS47DRAFT_1292210, partial [Hydnum rufescens UP504]